MCERACVLSPNTANPGGRNRSRAARRKRIQLGVFWISCSRGETPRRHDAAVVIRIRFAVLCRRRCLAGVFFFKPRCVATRKSYGKSHRRPADLHLPALPPPLPPSSTIGVTVSLQSVALCCRVSRRGGSPPATHTPPPPPTKLGGCANSTAAMDYRVRFCLYF